MSTRPVPNARLLAVLCATLAVGSAQAEQGVSLASIYTDFTTWTQFGSAYAQNDTPGNGFTYSRLVLTTTGTGGQSGAGFAPTPLALDFNQSFTFNFHFFIPVYAGIGLRGDGMTFVLGTTSGSGGGGSDLGYGGMPGSSVALAIDTFHFGGEPVSPSLQILANGNTTPLAATETGLGDTIRDHDWQWYARLIYTPSGNNDNTGTLFGHLEHFTLGSFDVQAPINFDALGMVGNGVFYGFTAGNGLAIDGHIVTSAMPVPEPGAGVLLLAGLWVVGRRIRGQR